ncbi:MAG: hypothetical protein V4543_06750 [Bacteroidota bacterium]
MIKTFTRNDLIRYVYGETDTYETMDIELALTQDERLMRKVDKLRLVKAGISRTLISPSDDVISRIFAYSRDNNLQPAHS